MVGSRWGFDLIRWLIIGGRTGIEGFKFAQRELCGRVEGGVGCFFVVEEVLRLCCEGYVRRVFEV